MYGYIHSTESFAAADGPGIRYTVFLQGCRMRCGFCHNPDTWSQNRGQNLTAREVISRAVRYRDFWGEKGGITVSGGEPMLQAEFVTELFREAHAQNIHTVLDTSAQPFDKNDKKYTELLNLCDLVLLDIKHIDSQKHKQLTGFDNGNILECAAYLASENIPAWIRHVVIPGYETEKELAMLGKFIKSLPNVRKIELLPYHTLGISKWEKLGIDYPLKSYPSATEKDIKHAEKIMLI